MLTKPVMKPTVVTHTAVQNVIMNPYILARKLSDVKIKEYLYLDQLIALYKKRN